MGRASKPSRAGGNSSCARGRAPAGACTRPAAGMAAGKAPQASWSCWQPARAAAPHAVCAAGGPPIPRHTCVCGRHNTRRRNQSSRGAQPASRSRRQAGRHLHSVCGGRWQQCMQPNRAAAGSWQGAGRGRPRGRQGIKNAGCGQAGKGEVGKTVQGGAPQGSLIRWGWVRRWAVDHKKARGRIKADKGVPRWEGVAPGGRGAAQGNKIGEEHPEVGYGV